MDAGCTSGVPRRMAGVPYQRQDRSGGWGGSELRAQRGLCPSLPGHSLAASPQGTMVKVSVPSSSLPPASSQTAALPTTTTSWSTSSCKWPPAAPPPPDIPEGPGSGLDQAARTTLGGGSAGTRQGLGHQQTWICVPCSPTGPHRCNHDCHRRYHVLGIRYAAATRLRAASVMTPSIFSITLWGGRLPFDRGRVRGTDSKSLAQGHTGSQIIHTKHRADDSKSSVSHDHSLSLL